jgi:hypothetical protein
MPVGCLLSLPHIPLSKNVYQTGGEARAGERAGEGRSGNAIMKPAVGDK